MASLAIRRSQRVCKEADEVCLLFEDGDSASAFVKEAQLSGMELFDQSDDVMLMVYPDTSSFAVHFDFLRLPGESWRIEVMHVVSGDAPLHEAALKERGSGCVFHVSFKMSSTDAYHEMFKDPEPEGGLILPVDGAGSHLASYVNSYGFFSYWQKNPESLLQLGEQDLPYWKPRVNTRDNFGQLSTDSKPV